MGKACMQYAVLHFWRHLFSRTRFAYCLQLQLTTKAGLIKLHGLPAVAVKTKIGMNDRHGS